MDKIIFLKDATKLALPSFQKTERVSEDPNLPIDDCRKIILAYKQWWNTNKQAYDRTYVAGRGRSNVESSN